MSAVNMLGQVLYHPQTPLLSVAPGSIGVVELVAVQNSGPVKKGVHEAVDGYHVGPDLAVVPAGIGGQEQTRQGHVGELRADIRNGGDFLDEALEEVGEGASGLSKMLGHICIKVPASRVPEEEI